MFAGHVADASFVFFSIKQPHSLQRPSCKCSQGMHTESLSFAICGLTSTGIPIIAFLDEASISPVKFFAICSLLGKSLILLVFLDSLQQKEILVAVVYHVMLDDIRAILVEQVR